MKKHNLIIVLGWEDRFLDGFKIICEDYTIESVILIYFNDYSEMIGMSKNKNDLLKITDKKNIKVHDLNLEYNNSIENWKTLNLFFKNNKILDVIINITTIPRETIWTLLFFLKGNNKKIDYVYFKPKEYNKGWLTKNHKEPRLLFKHSGIFDIEKKLALFVITGFDESRLLQLVDFYEPTKLIVFSQTGEQYNNLKRNKSLEDFSRIDINIVEIDSYKINESTKLISKYINDYEEFNVIIASQGPKTSSISTYNCYLRSDQNIGLAYVPARDFNDKYSIGIDTNYISGTFDFKID